MNTSAAASLTVPPMYKKATPERVALFIITAIALAAIVCIALQAPHLPIIGLGCASAILGIAGSVLAYTLIKSCMTRTTAQTSLPPENPIREPEVPPPPASESGDAAEDEDFFDAVEEQEPPPPLSALESGPATEDEEFFDAVEEQEQPNLLLAMDEDPRQTEDESMIPLSAPEPAQASFEPLAAAHLDSSTIQDPYYLPLYPSELFLEASEFFKSQFQSIFELRHQAFSSLIDLYLKTARDPSDGHDLKKRLESMLGPYQNKLFSLLKDNDEFLMWFGLDGALNYCLAPKGELSYERFDYYENKKETVDYLALLFNQLPHLIPKSHVGPTVTSLCLLFEGLDPKCTDFINKPALRAFLIQKFNRLEPDHQTRLRHFFFHLSGLRLQQECLEGSFQLVNLPHELDDQTLRVINMSPEFLLKPKVKEELSEKNRHSPNMHPEIKKEFEAINPLIIFFSIGILKSNKPFQVNLSEALSSRPNQSFEAVIAHLAEKASSN